MMLLSECCRREVNLSTRPDNETELLVEVLDLRRGGTESDIEEEIRQLKNKHGKIGWKHEGERALLG